MPINISIRRELESSAMRLGQPAASYASAVFGHVQPCVHITNSALTIGLARRDASGID